MERLKIASMWLGGCSGCHMSYLDQDEWLIDLAAVADYVYGPFVDTKVYPDDVDICLIEGAVCNEDNFEVVRHIRERTKYLISFGDCAVTGNVTALRNTLPGAEPCLKRSYLELATLQPEFPSDPGVLPPLLERVQPVHEVVEVDFYLPGCPPPADRIRAVMEALAAGREPQLEGVGIKFG
ncbi:MAG: oxidoreductase [Gemmataceae bacterium]